MSFLPAVNEGLLYVGASDRRNPYFENVYPIGRGASFNSYLYLDEKTALLDTADASVTEAFFSNVSAGLGGRNLDYLTVQHMEPDHSANIEKFVKKYPDAVIVGNAKTFTMIANFFEELDLGDKKLTVKDGEKLSLGKHELTFVFAPMVHWPEVMFTYDSTDKVLFSADAFGKFGALDTEEDWACKARRYYFGIVGKYGAQVQAVLKKAAALDISVICPLHGPVLSEDLPYYLGLYNTWSSYGVESEGVFIAYTSVYGNTKKAAELLAQKLNEKGCPKTVIADLAREDMAEAVEDAFRYGKIVLATTTYNADIFPFMKQFICELTERNYQNRTIGIIENGSWASTAAKVIKGMFEKSKNITFAENVVSIKSAVKQDNIAQIEALADELVK